MWKAGQLPVPAEQLPTGTIIVMRKRRPALENAGSGRARMLSSFAYRQVIQSLRAAAFRAGVEVLEVNPAYTSAIGAVNHAARFGISIHQSAAIAIARRGLGRVRRYG